jgi:molybdopterin converting factor small subunit
LVRYFAAARQAAGRSQEEIAAGRLGEVVATAAARHPGLAPVLARSTYLIDGRRADSDQLVSPGATVDVLPPTAGG